MTLAPNIKKLVIYKMSVLMIPPGTKEGTALQTGLAALTKPGNIGTVAKEAQGWVEAAIAAVRSAPDNPHRTDEEIAGEILRRIEEKKARRNQP